MGSCWKGAALTRIKAHSLTGRINLYSLEESFGCVRRNRGAAGIDRVSIQLYERQLLQNLAALERRLKGGTYPSLCDVSTFPKETQGKHARWAFPQSPTALPRRWFANS